jgi:trk system potassium uptake protein TrkA
MFIIVVGQGKVGTTLSSQLCAEGHDIVTIDNDPVVLKKLQETLDVATLCGNGAAASVLEEAGAARADLLIACTDGDEVNLLSCMVARKLGTKNTIARVRNPEYHRDADTLKREIGLDMLINPDLSAAREIARILSFPTVSSVEPFARGRIDMIGLQVTEKDSFVGSKLSALWVPRLSNVLVCAAEHGGEVVIPDGNYAPAAGDKLYLIGAKPDLQKVLKGIGRSSQRIKRVSVLGGSRTAVYLAWELARTHTKVRLVEISPDKCIRLASQLPDAMIIEGDCTSGDLIHSENIFDTDALVCLTDRDEENLLMAISAQRSGVGKVIAKMNRPNYIDLVRESGIDTIISPKDITAGQITRYVRALANSEGSAVESLYRMLNGAVEALEFTATASSRPVLDTPLKDLKKKHGILVAAIARDNGIIIPGGMTEIKEGDRVVIVSRSVGLNDLTDILA